MLLGTLGASLLSNLLSGKGLAHAGKGIVKPGEGVKKNSKILFDAISSINKY